MCAYVLRAMKQNRTGKVCVGRFVVRVCVCFACHETKQDCEGMCRKVCCACVRMFGLTSKDSLNGEEIWQGVCVSVLVRMCVCVHVLVMR